MLRELPVEEIPPQERGDFDMADEKNHRLYEVVVRVLTLLTVLLRLLGGIADLIRAMR